MRRRSSVILVRESEEQLSGSGCCGRLDGEFLDCTDGPVFPERRAVKKAMGPLYTTLRSHFGAAVDIEVVDPRNLFSLVFLLIRDFWEFRVGAAEALRTLGRLPVQAVVVNGRLVARGEWPDPLDVVRILDEAAQEPDLEAAVEMARPSA